MNNIFKLLKGELIRLVKYKILLIGLIVACIWCLIIGLANTEEVLVLIPMLLGMDATLMSILLLASSFYLEKQEGSIRSILVSPLKLSDVLISKVLAALLISLITPILVIVTSIIVHNIEFNIWLILPYTLVIVFSHTAIGYVITLNCKDFGMMIGLFALYAIIFYLPTILFALEIIPKNLEVILLVSPSHASQVLFNSLFGNVNKEYVFFALFYLLIIGFALYFGYVYKKYIKIAIEG